MVPDWVGLEIALAPVLVPSSVRVPGPDPPLRPV